MDLVLKLLNKERDEVIAEISHAKKVLRTVGLDKMAYWYNELRLKDCEKFLPQLTKAILILKNENKN